MNRWPYALPGHSIDGFSQTPFPTGDRTDFDSGAARARRRTKARRFETGVTWIMTDAEFKAFTDWYLGRPVNVAGSSDTIGSWVLTNVTVVVGGIVGPQDIAADLLLEAAVTGGHIAVTPVLPALAFDNLDVVLHATLKAAGRTNARVGLVDRNGTLRYADIDLATGLVTTLSSVLSSSVVDRGNGWFSVALGINTGSGSTTPRMRVAALNGSVGSYAGDPMLGIGVTEVSARIATGFDLFVPSDASGAAKGSEGEAGWFWYDMPMGGGLTRTECRFMAPYQSEGRAAFHWTVNATLEVRYA